jgi:hypothetical protein
MTVLNGKAVMFFFQNNFLFIKIMNRNAKKTQKITYNRLVFDFWANKSVIFVGPCNHGLTKEEIESHDIVVRTNNFFGMKSEELVSDRCEVLMVNHLFYRKYFKKQIPKMLNKGLRMVLVYGEFVNNCFHNVNGRVFVDTFERHIQFNPSVGKKPLLLSRFIAYLKQYPFKSMFITGLDFYTNQNVEERWKSSYTVPENFKMLQHDAKLHNVEKDKEYVSAQVLNDKRINVDIDIINILFEKESSQTVVIEEKQSETIESVVQPVEESVEESI